MLQKEKSLRISRGSDLSALIDCPLLKVRFILAPVAEQG